MLLISPFESNITRVTQKTANKRNELIAELADVIFVAYAQAGGNVERAVSKCLTKGKKVSTFDVVENGALIQAGAKVI